MIKDFILVVRSTHVHNNALRFRYYYDLWKNSIGKVALWSEMLGWVCKLVSFKWSGKELPISDITKRSCVLKRGSMLTLISVYQVPNPCPMIMTADSIWRLLQKWRNPDQDLILYLIKTEHGFAVLHFHLLSKTFFFLLSFRCMSKPFNSSVRFNQHVKYFIH